MFELMVFAVLMFKTACLYRGFGGHAPIFVGLSQSSRIRYWVLLIPFAPLILWVGQPILGVPISTMVALVCLTPAWSIAHAQSHFFDAKDTAHARLAQQWLVSVEWLAGWAAAYVLVRLLWMVGVQILRG